LGTLFFNSYLHGLQKLNCYNRVFKSYLQVLELDLKLVTDWKIKFKYLKLGEIFLKIFGFFSSTSIVCGKHSNIIFLVNGICFIAKLIPQPLKNDIIFGDTFGVLFQVQMIWHKLLWKARGMLEMPMKKTKSFVCFEMLKEG
jgi:hypothetical protein